MKKVFRLFAVIVSILVLLAILLLVSVLAYKDTILTGVIRHVLKEHNRNVSITVEKVVYELPDELFVRNLSIDLSSRFTSVKIPSFEMELNFLNMHRAVIMGNPAACIRRIFLVIDQIKYKEWVLSNISINLRFIPSEKLHFSGSITCDAITHDELKLRDIRSTLTCEGNQFAVALDSVRFSGGFLNGIAQGQFDNDTLPCSVSVNLVNINAADLFVILKLDSRLKMTGTWNGSVTAAITGNTLKALNGDLWAHPAGGVLSIPDKILGEQIVASSPSVNKNILDSVLRYTYSKGDMTVTLEDENILLHLLLNGETGKRDISLYLHDLLEQ